MQENISEEVMKTKYLSKLPYLSHERSQKFMSIALTLIALSFFGLFAISPTISTILKLRKELVDSQFVYDSLDSKIRNLSELRRQYADLQDDLPVIMDALPKEPNASLLFAQIQSAAQQSNVKIKKLENFEVEVLRNNNGVGKPYYSYTFSISGTGTFENIHNFVSTIESMQRIINVETFAMNNAYLNDNQSLTFDIKGTTFFKQ